MHRIPTWTLAGLLALTFACDKQEAKKVEVSQEKAEGDKKEAPGSETTKVEDSIEKNQETAEKKVEDGILGIGSTPGDIKPGEDKVYGGRFTIIEPPISLKQALAKSEESPGPYKVEATIAKVCQAKGCWFTLKSDEVEIPIRVRMKDYKFFVPKNAEEALAIVEGTVSRKTIDQATAQHYADDAAKASGKEPEKVEGPQETYEFMITAAEIRAPSEG